MIALLSIKIVLLRVILLFIANKASSLSPELLLKKQLVTLMVELYTYIALAADIFVLLSNVVSVTKISVLSKIIMKHDNISLLTSLKFRRKFNPKTTKFVTFLHAILFLHNIVAFESPY